MVVIILFFSNHFTVHPCYATKHVAPRRSVPSSKAVHGGVPGRSAAGARPAAGGRGARHDHPRPGATNLPAAQRVWRDGLVAITLLTNNSDPQDPAVHVHVLVRSTGVWILLCRYHLFLMMGYDAT